MYVVKDFMVRYSGLFEHWIGLRRESGQPWKWVNGTIFSQQLFEVRAEGNCAYVSDVSVSSSRCYSLRNWICSKPDAHTKGKEDAVE
uniref:C-type lectin domain-containing protein n=1 Tax=Chelydra serpentina TaxID=8475 RepID=A0A8C3SLS3_CHESE